MTPGKNFAAGRPNYVTLYLLLALLYGDLSEVAHFKAPAFHHFDENLTDAGGAPGSCAAGSQRRPGDRRVPENP